MSKKARKEETPLFQGTAMADDTRGRDAKTNVAIPSDDAEKQLKEWMEEGKL